MIIKLVEDQKRDNSQCLAIAVVFSTNSIIGGGFAGNIRGGFRRDPNLTTKAGSVYSAPLPRMPIFTSLRFFHTIRTAATENIDVNNYYPLGESYNKNQKVKKKKKYSLTKICYQI